MIAGLMGIASELLGLIRDKDATKYAEKYLKLRKKYAKELNANPSDHAVLDNIERELSDLLTATTVYIKDLKK